MLGGRNLVGINHHPELTVDDVQKIYKALIHAVQSHRISEERVNESVDRILRLKNRYDLFSSKRQMPPMNPFDHQELSKKIAAAALQTIHNGPIPSIKESRLVLFAPESIRDTIDQTTLTSLGKKTDALFFNSKTILTQDIIEQSDIIIFCSYNAWKDPAQIAMIELLSKTQKPMILIALRDPIDASLFPKIPLIISTFSPTASSIQAACECLALVK
jgi:beta-N-acetylhexosaminidase